MWLRYQWNELAFESKAGDLEQEISPCRDLLPNYPPRQKVTVESLLASSQKKIGITIHLPFHDHFGKKRPIFPVIFLPFDWGLPKETNVR